MTRATRQVASSRRPARARGGDKPALADARRHRRPLAPLGGSAGPRRPNGAAPVRKLTIEPLEHPPPPRGLRGGRLAFSRGGDRRDPRRVYVQKRRAKLAETPWLRTRPCTAPWRMCVHKKAPWLFEKLRAKLEGRVYKRVRALKASAAAMDPETFLCAFDTAWQEHCDAVDTTRRVFLYLDRARVGARVNTIERRETSGEPPRAIWDVGVALFREALVDDKRSNEGRSGLITGSRARRRRGEKRGEKPRIVERTRQSVERERESRVRDGRRVVGRDASGGAGSVAPHRARTRRRVSRRAWFDPSCHSCVRRAQILPRNVRTDVLRKHGGSVRARGRRTARDADPRVRAALRDAPARSRDVRRRAGRRRRRGARLRSSRAAWWRNTCRVCWTTRSRRRSRRTKRTSWRVLYLAAVRRRRRRRRRIGTTRKEPRRRRPCRRGRLREVRGCRAPRVRVEPP